MHVTLRLLALASILLIAELATAETLPLATLPSRPGKAGFLMAVEVETVGGNGYHGVYLNFTPLGKQFTRDRHLQVVVGPRNHYSTDLNFDLRVSVHIPQGSKLNRVPVYVPHYYPWHTLTISIYEDGRLIETGRATMQLPNGLRSRFAKQNSSVGIIVAKDDATQDAAWKRFPDVRTLVTVLGDGPIPETVNVPRLIHPQAKSLAQEVQPAWVQFRLIEENALHETWLGYSQLDVIIVAAPVLHRIETQSPSQFRALKNWLAAGGNLWVYAASQPACSLLIEADPPSLPGSRFMAGKDIAASLALSQFNDTSELTYENWQNVMKASQHYSSRSRFQNMSRRQQIYDASKAAGHPFATVLSSAELTKQVRMGPYGAGVLTVIEPDDPFPGSYQFWKSVSLLHTPMQLQWVHRNGVDVPSGNDNYWMWLIESVGQPPVKSFVFLNTLFVIIVGPFCYFLFRRRGRLYLLYFFAPFLAMLVTAGLFAYALAADGTKTQTKVRQITWLDLEHGSAVDQSRQTYYAVFGSGGGLEFSLDTAVYPIRNTPAVDRYYRRRQSSAREGAITINSDSQQLTKSFLPPRNQMQYLVTKPYEIDEPLVFQLAAGSAHVTNRFPYAIETLLVNDANSNYWIAEHIAEGATVTLAKTSSTAVADLLNEDVLPPLGEVPMLQMNRARFGAQAGMQVSLLENKLQRWSQGLPRRSFVAVAEVTKEPLGVREAVVVDSVHVLMGEIP